MKKTMYISAMILLVISVVVYIILKEYLTAFCFGMSVLFMAYLWKTSIKSSHWILAYVPILGICAGIYVIIGYLIVIPKIMETVCVYLALFFLGYLMIRVLREEQRKRKQDNEKKSI